MQSSCKEEELKTSALNIRISPLIYLSDLYSLQYQIDEKNLESFQELRYETACIYLSNISNTSNLKFGTSHSKIETNDITLLPDWSVVLNSSTLLFMTHSSTSLSREHLKTLTISKKIQEYSLKRYKSISFAVLSVCKLWIKFKHEVVYLIDKLNLDQFTQEISKEIEEIFYSKAKVPVAVIVSALNQYRKASGRYESIETTLNSHQAFSKPVVELFTLEHQKSLSESFESNSENTDKMDLSFSVSDTLNERFPRFSATSILVTETPCKDSKKSFTEYAESIGSPNYNFFTSPKKIISSTPIDSPKQSTFSIQEVKKFLTIEDRETLSPFGKPDAENKKNFLAKICNFEDDDLKKTVQSEFTNYSDANKGSTKCEGRNHSCHCNTCCIM